MPAEFFAKGLSLAKARPTGHLDISSTPQPFASPSVHLHNCLSVDIIFSVGFINDMATSDVKPLGVTAPLSVALPTEAENQASNALIEELKRQNNYESTSDTNKR